MHKNLSNDFIVWYCIFYCVVFVLLLVKTLLKVFEEKKEFNQINIKVMVIFDRNLTQTLNRFQKMTYK